MDEIYNRQMAQRPNGEDMRWIFSDSQQDQPTINEVQTWCLTAIKIVGRAEITFSYSDKKRENGIGFFPDIPQKLDCINVYDTNRNLIKNCTCTYRANDMTSCDEYDPQQRGITFLDQVTLSGNGIYSMQYNDTGLTFPDIGTYGIDWYGYYNNDVYKYNFMTTRVLARNGDSYLETIRKPKFETTKYGMLTGIKYPTGGSSQFEYEQNTYSVDITGFYTSPANRPTAGLRLAGIRNFDTDGREVLNRTFSYLSETGGSSGQLLWRPVIYSRYISHSSGYTRIERETLSSSCDFPY